MGSLVVSRYQTNHNFLPSPTSDRTTASKLFNEFQKTNILINGIVGEKVTANIYKELFENCGKKTKIHMIQGLYRCDKVNVPNYEMGLKFRIADDRDIKRLGEWIEAFRQEAIPHDPPVIGAVLAKARIDQKMIYVLEKNGELISMAAWGRDIESSCSVNLVYTPKSLRKNGYASVATAKLTEHLLNNGKKETNLYTDMTNPTSNKIYVDVGYEFVCDSVHIGVS